MNEFWTPRWKWKLVDWSVEQSNIPKKDKKDEELTALETQLRDIERQIEELINSRKG